MLASFYLRKNEAEKTRQWNLKRERSEKLLGAAFQRALAPDALGDRTRVDVMWREGAMGLRGPSGPEGAYDFVSLFADGETPDAPSPGALAAMQTLVQDPLPLSLAQLRFREGIHGAIGLWIDTANLEIKALLDEGAWLERRIKAGWTVELGQKRKEVVAKDGTHSSGGGWTLEAAQPHPWLASYTADNQTIPLLSTVASFSQPGPEVNRALLALGFDLLNEADIGDLPWREWGAGYGNLTAAYASRLGPQGEASELEDHAVELLHLNARTYFPSISVKREAAERSSLENSQAELWLIDPPRPGFGALLRMLEGSARKPRWVLAYHCHENGLTADSTILRGLGYKLRGASGVDAFPTTPHLEVISLWQLP